MKMKSHRRACAIGALGILIAAAAMVCAAPGRGFVRQQKVAKAQFAGPSAKPEMSRPRTALGARLASAYGKLPLAFEPNRGQTDARVKFLARGGYTLFLTKNAAVLDFPVASDQSKAAIKSGEAEKGVVLNSRLKVPISKKAPQIADSVLQMRLVGVNPNAAVGGEDELPGKSNYFIGNDPKKWRTDVPQYARVKYSEIYPGVNLVYYGNQSGQLEYDFQVAPGADPSAITFEVAAERGSRDQNKACGKAKPNPSLHLDANGDLLVKLAGGEVRFHKPVVYQTISDETRGNAPKKFITGRYLLANGNLVRFAIANYDKSKPLVIDPVMLYSSYIGGSGYDQGSSIAVDGSGNAFLTGYTTSADFPVVNQIPGACNGACGQGNGRDDAFVIKVNATGTALVYSSYIGGTDYDLGHGVAVDGSGDAYLIGQTASTDFPVVNQIPGACSTRCLGFVTTINAAGDALVNSSLISALPEAITLDSSDNLYLTGSADLPYFPIVNQIPGACNGTCATGGGPTNAFVTKINAGENALVYSSLIGGSGSNQSGMGDEGSSIAVDDSGNTYLTGSTASTNFPVVNQIPGACNEGCGNGALQNAFLTKVNAAGSALVYSSYIGGGLGDGGNGVAVDSSGNAYLAGSTSSTNFPVVNQIAGACNGKCGSDLVQNAFVTKVNAAGSALIYSSRIGGSDYEIGYGIAVDGSGNAYLTGSTSSTDFPIVDQIPGACIGACSVEGAAVNAFITEVNAAGSALVNSSKIGGSFIDYALAIAMDSSGNAYLTGYTESTDFPRVKQIPGACNGTCGSGSAEFPDVFVTKITSAPTPWVSLTPASLSFAEQLVGSTSPAGSVTLQNVGSGTLNISGIAITGTDSGDFTQTNTCGATLAAGANCPISVTFMPAATGTPSAALTVTDDAPNSPESMQLNGVGTDLSFGAQTGGSTSETVTAGEVATYNLQASPSAGFTGDVSMTCSGAPMAAICNVSPPTVSVTGSSPVAFVVTVSTTARSFLLWDNLKQRNPGLLPEYLLVLLALITGLLLSMDRRRARGKRILAMLPAFALVVILFGCGGNSNSSSSGGGGTPAGNYTIVVTGKAQGVVRTLSLSLTVQ
jgi:Beta-propeller repeat